jgi:glutathione S-transferase
MTMAITLYTDGFYISPYAFSAFVALEEKGLGYRMVKVPLNERAHRRPEYLERAVTGRVPALDHDGFHLAESSAIVEYLEDVFPTPRVLPADAKARARARMVMAWIRSDLMPIREERSTYTIWYEPATKPLSPEGQAAAARLVDAAVRLVPDGATALFGDWCVADSDLALMLQRLASSGYELPAKLRRFIDTEWSRPSVQKWNALPRDPYVPYG